MGTDNGDRKTRNMVSITDALCQENLHRRLERTSPVVFLSPVGYRIKTDAG
jgi:hypothetical protein